ncbi:hypothetical protein GJ496_004343 [Pomphorhynchus laevis]|nr:hypothetical protein GJ496_004343 [Pomphorhynchus laevis]
MDISELFTPEVFATSIILGSIVPITLIIITIGIMYRNYGARKSSSAVPLIVDNVKILDKQKRNGRLKDNSKHYTRRHRNDYGNNGHMDQYSNYSSGNNDNHIKLYYPH